MKLIIISILTLVVSLKAHAFDKIKINFSQVCTEKKCSTITESMAIKKAAMNNGESLLEYIGYPVQLRGSDCYKMNNCYLYIGAAADTFEISINDHTITNLIRDKKNFIYHESSLVPIPSLLIDELSVFKIKVKDLNKDIIGINDQSIYFGARSLFVLDQYIDWLKRTGVTFFSAYSMFIFALLSGIAALIIGKKKFFSIFIYSIVSLFTFSVFQK